MSRARLPSDSFKKKKRSFCCFRIDGFLFARIWAFHLKYSKSTTFTLHTTIRSCTHERVGGVYHQPTVGNLELFVLSFCLRGICFNGRFFVFTPPRCCFTPKTVSFRVLHKQILLMTLIVVTCQYTLLPSAWML